MQNKERAIFFSLRKYYKNSGITLVSLIITIIVMLIIAGTTIPISLQRFQINSLKKLYSNIELLQDKVLTYYLRYGGLPIVRDSSNNPIIYATTLNFETNVNDSGNYYIIDLSAMDGIALNYGEEGISNPTPTAIDIFIINEISHTIYYVKGVEFDGVIYHTIVKETIAIMDTIPPSQPEIKIVSGIKNNDGIYITEVEIEIVPGKDNWSGVSKTEFIINNGTPINITELTNNIYKITENGTYKIIAITYDNNGKPSSATALELKISLTQIGTTNITLDLENITATTLISTLGTATWTSSNEEIVTVSSSTGTVTTIKSVSPGTATITAIYEGKTETCNVTVLGLVLDKTSLNLEEPDPTDTPDANTIMATPTFGTVTWSKVEKDSNVTSIHIKPEGNRITVTAVALGSATITASIELNGTTYTKSCNIVVSSQIAVGNYVKWEVSYTDVFTNYEFNKTTDNVTTYDGWRILNYTDNGNGTYSNVKLISTAIPAIFYYNNSSPANWWDKDTSLNTNIRVTNVMAADGAFENIPFYDKPTYDALSSNKRANTGYYIDISGDKTSASTGNKLSRDVFKDSNFSVTDVHILTLAEINRSMNRLNGTSRPDSSTSSGYMELSGSAKGLFDISDLSNLKDYSGLYNFEYWLATPIPSGAYEKVGIIRVDYTLGFVTDGKTTPGVRPVITLAGNIMFKKYGKNGTDQIYEMIQSDL